MTRVILRGKPNVGSPHSRFEEGKVASYPTSVGLAEGGATRGAKLRRESLSDNRAMKWMLAVVALAMIPMLALADTEVVDGVEWTYTVSDGKAKVGPVSFSDSAIPRDTEGAVSIPATLGGWPVAEISGQAFNRCANMTSLTIPEGVTSIGFEAFIGCSSLTSVTIPASVTSIGSVAFYGCSALTSLTIPEGVTSIDPYTFYECSSLTSLAIPASVTSIGNDAFRECSALTSVTIPEGVTSIGNYAFYHCGSLASLTIPASVTSIGLAAFTLYSSVEVG